MKGVKSLNIIILRELDANVYIYRKTFNSSYMVINYNLCIVMLPVVNLSIIPVIIAEAWLVIASKLNNTYGSQFVIMVQNNTKIYNLSIILVSHYSLVTRYE